MASKKSPTPKNPMTTNSASRIQSTQAKAGNETGKGTFPARAQAAAATNVNKVATETPSGKGTGGRKSPTKTTKK